jgi:hypothetical protein
VRYGYGIQHIYSVVLDVQREAPEAGVSILQCKSDLSKARACGGSEDIDNGGGKVGLVGGDGEGEIVVEGT